MDGDCEQSSTEGNSGNFRGNRTSDARGEDLENHCVTLSGGADLQDGDKLERSGLAADSVSSLDHLDTERTYVWYACYASNLWEARFLCYIRGGQVEGMGMVCPGSRNQTPPVDSRWTMVSNNLFFGHSWTRTWGSGGVAFLDPVSHGGPPNTHVRLYKITLQQLCDLLIQENKGDPNNSQVLIEWDHVNKLRESQFAPSHATFDFLKVASPNWSSKFPCQRLHFDILKELITLAGKHNLFKSGNPIRGCKEGAWYGTIKYLGEEDGLPMLTVTCSVEYMQRFRERQFQVCPPSDRYSKVILRGLLEHGTLSEEESKAYIASKSKGFPEGYNYEEI